MNRTLWRFPAALLTAGTTVLALGGTVAAQPIDAGTGTTSLVSAAARQEAREFWTPDRMRSATPMAAPQVTAQAAQAAHAAPAAVGAPSTVAATPLTTATDTTLAAARSFPNNGATWPGTGAIVKTAGRVFFTYQGRTASCSGNAVTSGNKSTIITAGHCVKIGGVFHTNWVFVPAYDSGATPYGTWAARALKATPQWVASENISFDIGAAVVDSLNGASLTDVVGGQGVAFNQPRQQNMYAFGYPAAAPYDGKKLTYCAGKASNEWLGTGDIGLACTMTGGASGGPWFLKFDEKTGTGLLNSVNSFKYNFSPAFMFGPYFGDDAQKLYETAQLT